MCPPLGVPAEGDPQVREPGQPRHSGQVARCVAGRTKIHPNVNFRMTSASGRAQEGGCPQETPSPGVSWGEAETNHRIYTTGPDLPTGSPRVVPRVSTDPSTTWSCERRLHTGIGDNQAKLWGWIGDGSALAVDNPRASPGCTQTAEIIPRLPTTLSPGGRAGPPAQTALVPNIHRPYGYYGNFSSLGKKEKRNRGGGQLAPGPLIGPSRPRPRMTTPPRTLYGGTPAVRSYRDQPADRRPAIARRSAPGNIPARRPVHVLERPGRRSGSRSTCVRSPCSHATSQVHKPVRFTTKSPRQPSSGAGRRKDTHEDPPGT